jgi:hypothetical protein
MSFLQLPNDEGACASYRFGCTTQLEQAAIVAANRSGRHLAPAR